MYLNKVYQAGAANANRFCDQETGGHAAPASLASSGQFDTISPCTAILGTDILTLEIGLLQGRELQLDHRMPAEVCLRHTPF